MYRRILACLAIVAASVACPVDAQEDADAMIDRGVTLREQGQDEQALEVFRQVHAQSGSARALAQMALAEQALGRWAEAHAHLEEAIRSDHEWIESHRGVLEQALATIAERTGRIELSGGVEGAEVLVNGQPVGTLPLTAPIRVAAGSAVVTVRAEGYHPFERSVRVSAGGLARESVSLVSRDGEPPSASTAAAAAEPAGAAVPPAASAGGGDASGWIVFGVSGGVAVAGAVLLAVGQLDEASVENAARGESWADYEDAAARAPILSPVGIVALSVGVAGMAAGIVWAIAGDDGSDTEVAVGPGGIRVRGSF